MSVPPTSKTAMTSQQKMVALRERTRAMISGDPATFAAASDTALLEAVRLAYKGDAKHDFQGSQTETLAELFKILLARANAKVDPSRRVLSVTVTGKEPHTPGPEVEALERELSEAQQTIKAQLRERAESERTIRALRAGVSSLDTKLHQVLEERVREGERLIRERDEARSALESCAAGRKRARPNL